MIPQRPLRLVFVGLSLTSSWGNGHATTYRSLLRALHARGHDITFLERDMPWYAANRDLPDPDFCRLHLYDHVEDLRTKFTGALADADAVILGSYVPDGIAAARIVQTTATGVTALYDIDTPVTVAGILAGDCDYLARDVAGGFDLYLSFTSGPLLSFIEDELGAARARALHCAVDPQHYRPLDGPRRWDLGYLGTYSADRQPPLEELLLEPARRRPDLRFVVAGPQYPDDIDWPENVQRIDHVPPDRHADFYSALRWTLNVTRADMIRSGYSPSVRLFEAAACGTPIISDHWEGLDEFFIDGQEIRIARSAADVLATLDLADAERGRIAEAARRRVLAQHTADRRAAELEELLSEAAAEKNPSERPRALEEA
ncbi:glycosyltransferase [Inquilinus sp. CAU 1745]|uniref:CgeB family protein n=1 Tax=Inquilinus sp. CAU 1745 TaxID=3140369 RepID=UPI00325B6A3E